MENLEVNPSPSDNQNAKHKSRDKHPRSSRAVSHNGDSSTKCAHARYDELASIRSSREAGTSGMADRSKPSEQPPSLTVNGHEEEETYENIPLPPPMITSDSVMATARLRNSLSDLLDAIKLYEIFDEICHDTPAWSYSIPQQVTNIRHSLRNMRQTAGYISYLREGGRGIVDRGQLEVLAKDVVVIEKEARKEWSNVSLKYKKNNGEEGEQEQEKKEKSDEELAKNWQEQMKTYRQFVKETYLRKMKSKLGQLKEAAGEVEILKGQLKTMWEDISQYTQEELEQMDEEERVDAYLAC